MDFKEIENKFQNLEDKINSKKDDIRRVHIYDYKKINSLFNLENNNQTKFHMNFNECRDLLLKSIIETRNDHLDKINTHVNDNLRKYGNKFEIIRKNLNDKFLKIKNEFVYFKNGELLHCQPILRKIQFEKSNGLDEVCKYSKLMPGGKHKIRLEIIDLLSLLPLNLDQIFISLPNNRVLVYGIDDSEKYKKIMICDYNHSKLFYDDGSIQQIRATTWNIIVLFVIGGESKKVGIYDFNLETIYTISLDFYSDEIYINKNEFAFKNKENILVYSNDTFKSATIKLQSNKENEKFYVYRRDNFLHFNSTHLYFINDYKTIYALDRLTGNKLFSFGLKMNADYELRVVKFDSESNIYSFNLNEKVINVYNPYGQKMYHVNFEKRYLTLCFDAYDNLICNQGVVGGKFNLEFEIY